LISGTQNRVQPPVFPPLRFHNVILAFHNHSGVVFLSEGTVIVSERNSRFQIGKISSTPVLIGPFVVHQHNSQDGDAYANQVATKRLTDEHFWKNVFL
jgi:hypothetical protein